MRFFIGLATCIALAGCETPGAELSATAISYIGQPIERVIAQQGPPVNAFDTSDGRKAYQWDRSYEVRRGGGSVAFPNGNGGFTVARARTRTKTKACFMTLYVRAAVVEAYEPPRC